MKFIDINVLTREETGKNRIKKMRKANFIPAILYGGEQKMIKLHTSDVDRIYNIRHENFLIHLTIDEKDKRDAFLKSIQYNPVTNKIIHLDLIELIKGKAVSIKIPIDIKGTPEGVKLGGVLEHFIWEVEVECLPKDIPDKIEIDVSNLKIGDSLHIRDLAVPENVKIVDDPEKAILTIGLPAGVGEEEEAAEAEAAEGKEKAEGEEKAESEKAKEGAAEEDKEKKSKEKKSADKK